MQGAESFFFRPETMLDLGRENHSRYISAAPFPHIVLDNFLPEAVARRVAAQFPSPSFAGFHKNDNLHQVNKQSRLQDSYFDGVSPDIRLVLNEFCGMVFLDFLQALTGITGLIADPHFFGGALHQILPGGKLDIHSDFSRDERRLLDRRLNVLLYLNDDWHDEYGGHLELWDAEMTHCVVKTAPVLNRCVIFSTTDHSFHGHPDPLKCPVGRSRNSIALYYYTNGRDDGSGGGGMYKTNWRKRPQET